MSNTLEACQPFSIDEFNEFISRECNTSDRTFSCHFLNVDGNASNFDFLAATLHEVKFPSDVIGIAETNIKADCAHLYPLDGYSSLYQNKILRKKKGSWVALYINEKYNYTKIQDLSVVTSDIESIFVRITNSTGVINVGVVYRPPGGMLIISTNHYLKSCHLLKVAKKFSHWGTSTYSILTHQV